MAFWLKLVAIIIFLHWSNDGSRHLGSLGNWQRSLEVLFLNWLFGSFSLPRKIGLSVVRVENFENLVCLAIVSSLKKHVHVDSELDRVTSRSRPEVVLTSLEPVSPSVELHRGHLIMRGIRLVQVE